MMPFYLFQAAGKFRLQNNGLPGTADDIDRLDTKIEANAAKLEANEVNIYF